MKEPTNIESDYNVEPKEGSGATTSEALAKMDLKEGDEFIFTEKTPLSTISKYDSLSDLTIGDADELTGEPFIIDSIDYAFGIEFTKKRGDIRGGMNQFRFFELWKQGIIKPA